MPLTVVLWTVVAGLLFWTVGAYNRLVRLRAKVNSAFAVLAVELSRQVALVCDSLPGPEATQPAPPDGDRSLWASLHGAAAQCAASLAMARTRPLEAEGIAALSAAHEVLSVQWEWAEREDSHDLAGPRLPDTVTTQWALIVIQAQVAIDQFDQAVERYNNAIAQFPAALLAGLFGFKAGRGIRSHA
jgi:LemA protein